MSLFDKNFIKWWTTRLGPFVDVPEAKLAAEREAVERMQEYNHNYQSFLQQAVIPAVDQLIKLMAEQRLVHRVTTWGNQLSIRIHLAWRWGELVISQSHEDAVTFEHHIITEGERRGDDQSEDHSHQYDLKDPVPKEIAHYELMFFMTRLAMDLVEGPEEPELPPGEKEEDEK
ncbi:MAG: hypothetical protein QM770_24600 [Tepidisphaeraceae bacterium]